MSERGQWAGLRFVWVAVRQSFFGGLCRPVWQSLFGGLCGNLCLGDKLVLGGSSQSLFGGLCRMSSLVLAIFVWGRIRQSLFGGESSQSLFGGRIRPRRGCPRSSWGNLWRMSSPVLGTRPTTTRPATGLNPVAGRVVFVYVRSDDCVHRMFLCKRDCVRRGRFCRLNRPGSGAEFNSNGIPSRGTRYVLQNKWMYYM